MFLRAPRILHCDYLVSAMSSSACQVCFQPSSKVLNAGVCIDLSISSCGIPRFIQCRYIYTYIYIYIRNYVKIQPVLNTLIKALSLTTV